MINNLDAYSFPTKSGGLLLSTQNCPNGNMTGATSQLLTLVSDIPNAWAYYDGLKDCIINDALSRYPNLPENTSIDDYLALTCNPYYARVMLRTVRKRLGFFDINFPKVKAAQWLWRFPALWAHMKLSANAGNPGSRYWVGPIAAISWCISIYIAAGQPFGNQDNWIESHLMVLQYEKQKYTNWGIMNKGVDYWRAKKGYKTTSDIMAEYTGIPDHPLVQAWKPYN